MKEIILGIICGTLSGTIGALIVIPQAMPQSQPTQECDTGYSVQHENGTVYYTYIANNDTCKGGKTMQDKNINFNGKEK